MIDLATERSVSALLRRGAAVLEAAGIESARPEAEWLLASLLGVDRAALHLDPARRLATPTITRYLSLVDRRAAREPLQYLLGWEDFHGIRLAVTPDVLVPRPETETVIEAALDFVVRSGLRMEKLRVLDIGTGSGALLLALLQELPGASGVGTDISAAAIEVARANARRCGLDGRCTFIECAIAAGVQGPPFDLVVSNPPYIAHDEIGSLAPEVREFDPAVALDGGKDGLDAYRAIAAEARRILAPGGRMFVELGIGQEAQVRALFTKAGLSVGAPRKDLAGIQRVLGAGFTP